MPNGSRESASATYRGYRIQTLYVLARLRTDDGAEHRVYRPEDDKDLAVFESAQRLAEVVQVKDYESDLALSGLKPSSITVAEAEAMIDALRGQVRRPAPGLPHHSDRGSQYASGDYRQLLKDHGMTCSMSRKGNCWDNAVMESFYRSIKAELIHHEEFQTREEARRAIFEYIEVFCSRVRRHSTQGYLSPLDYELAL